MNGDDHRSGLQDFAGRVLERVSQAAQNLQNGEREELSDVALLKDLQRFTGLFFSWFGQAMEQALASVDRESRAEVFRYYVRGIASVVDIASDSNPAVGLLDMHAFLALTRDAIEKFWIPKHLGEPGRQLIEAIDKSEHALWVGVSSKVLSRDQLERLGELIHAWQEANPDQYMVSFVRVFGSDLASELGVAQASNARGLLAGVTEALEKADQALMTSERALFLAQRLPFMVRFHAEIAAEDIGRDVFGLRLHRFARRWLVVTGVCIAALIVLFWSGYVVAKKVTASADRGSIARIEHREWGLP